jgi:hypothetical protein
LSYWVATPGVVVDSNMVPFLVQALERRDGPFQKAYATAWMKFAWLRKISPTPPRDTFVDRLNAAHLLTQLGMNSKAAKNALTRAAKNDESSIVRMIAASSSARLSGNDDAKTNVKDELWKDDAARGSDHATNAIDPEAAARAAVQ